MSEQEVIGSVELGFENVDFSGLVKEELEKLVPGGKRNIAASFPTKDTMQFLFKDGKGLLFDFQSVSEKVQNDARNQGFKTKLANALALSKDVQEAKDDTERRGLVLEVWEHLTGEAGTWNKPSKDGGKALAVKAEAAEMKQVKGNVAKALEDGSLSQEMLEKLRSLGVQV